MSYHKQVKRLLLAGVATATFATAIPAISGSVAYAQDYTTGAIDGFVQDTTGNVVAGATITIKSNRGGERTSTSGSDGSFRFPRLSIGSYTVTVSHEGHETLTEMKVSVALGKTASPTFTMAIPGSDIEEIVVSGMATGNWDFNSTTSGISINVDDLMNNAPVARDLTAIALLAPGTTAGDAAFGNLASFSGASVAENAYYVNGMNITEYRNFLGSSEIPFDFIEAVEVKTSGYSAEFGRATGGIINNVTRSGTNDFHFGANLYWAPAWGEAKGKNVQQQLNQFESDNDIEYNIWASGPLIRDKLFFAGIYQWNDREYDRYTTDVRQDTVDKSKFWGLKFDFEPFDGHRFEATLFSNAGETRTKQYGFLASSEVIEPNGDGEQYRVPIAGIEDMTAEELTGAYTGAEDVAKFGGLNKIFKYTGVFTDWLTLSGMYGVNPVNANEFTDPNTNHLARIIDSRNAQGFFPVPGFASATSFGIDTDERKAWRVDADVYFSFMGDHHIRMGIDKENLHSEHSVNVSGGVYWRYYDCNDTDILSDGVSQGCLFTDGEVLNGDEYVRHWDEQAGGGFDIIQTAQYIQDSWEVNEDLTLLLGLRNETFDNRNPNGDTFIKSKNQLALRLGFTWDPTGNGNSRVFGSFGRTYLPVAGNTNIRNSSAETFILTYYNFDSIDPITWAPIGLDAANPVWTRTFDDGVLPNPATKAQIGLNPMYQDEFTLGYEMQLDNGWSLKATAIRRDLKSIIEDIGVNHALAAWGEANGMNDFDSGFGAGMKTASETYTEYLLNPSHSLHYIMANPGTDLNYLTDFFGASELTDVTLSADSLGFPEPKRTYTAIELEAKREWDGQWSVDASYTMSWAKGNTEGSVNSDLQQDDAGLTQDFDLPATLIGADGYTANDRRHRFKVRGAYQVTDTIRASFNAQVTSPRKFGCFGNLPADFTLDAAFGDDWEYQSRYGAEYWFCDGEVSPRGSTFKSEWSKKLDLSLMLTPAFNDDIPGAVVFKVDVFNVFNAQGINAYSFQKELDQTVLGAAVKQNWRYGQASARAQPRYVRFSAKYKF